MKKIFQTFKYRKFWLMCADIFIVVTAALIADLIIPLIKTDILITILQTSAYSLIFLFLFGAYNKLWRYFNRWDYLSCLTGLAIGFIMSFITIRVFEKDIPFSFTVLHYLIALIGICSFRFLFRSAFITLVDTGKEQSQRSRAMIIGGGQACYMLLREITSAMSNPEICHKAHIHPVCIIDDNKLKIGKSICGVEVVGTTHDIKRLAEELQIEQIIFAIPSLMGENRKRILDICSETNLPVKVLPFIGNLIFEENHSTLLGQVRDINVEDLLGREPIRFDNKEISNFINGKICMVTGGGGSIGSEIVRQIAKYNAKRVIIVDIYENNAYDIQQEMKMEYGDSIDVVTLIASVRDHSRMDHIYGKYKPEIVFHAAAHKHVPLMEVSPMEAIKNNVIGTHNAASLAQLHNVEKFIMISTDKAVNPTNVMGASKRCCEMIVQYLAQKNDSKTEFITTRFGNVLGSNGSVIPLFKKQIEQGKAVTVTHPDIIRYFMTIPEAVNLVLEAAAIANGGEIFVLDMGEPVKIVTLAENLIRMYGKIPYKDVEIKFIGLRPGEKIQEELLMNEEGLKKTSNKLIFIGKQIEIKPDEFVKKLTLLRDAALENNEPAAVQALHDIVPTFVTPEEYNNKVLVK